MQSAAFGDELERDRLAIFYQAVVELGIKGGGEAEGDNSIGAIEFAGVDSDGVGGVGGEGDEKCEEEEGDSHEGDYGMGMNEVK